MCAVWVASKTGLAGDGRKNNVGHVRLGRWVLGLHHHLRTLGHLGSSAHTASEDVSSSFNPPARPFGGSDVVVPLAALTVPVHATLRALRALRVADAGVSRLLLRTSLVEGLCQGCLAVGPASAEPPDHVCSGQSSSP